KDAIDKINTDSDEELDDLLWEYTRLFIGPYKLPCPPWESVYTSTKRLMMQDAYAEVRNLYAETGLTISSPDIMFDHIGAELNFLAVLLQRMNSEPEKSYYYRDIAKKFLDRHLMNWVPQFARDMENASDSLLYRTLPKVTGHVLYMITEGDFS
ncbi:MAG: molecular chaperone TorD family protein, partial [Nitrospirae bacterium]|nr:molecular chaperone TorD family protein [Nitrospirota bacterium]